MGTNRSGKWERIYGKGRADKPRHHRGINFGAVLEPLRSATIRLTELPAAAGQRSIVVGSSRVWLRQTSKCRNDRPAISPTLPTFDPLRTVLPAATDVDARFA